MNALRLALITLPLSLLAVACSPEPETSTPAQDATQSSASAPSSQTQDKCDKEGDFDMHLSRVDAALQQLAHASGCFVQYENLDQYNAKQPHEVSGTMTIREAVATALKGTGLTLAATDQPNTLKVVAKDQ